MKRKSGNASFQSAMAYVNKDLLPKGVPVPGTGGHRHKCNCCKRSRAGKPSGVLSRERLLPHRYADEGDRGPEFRRQLRRLSRNFWLWDQGVNGDWSRRSGRGGDWSRLTNGE